MFEVCSQFRNLRLQFKLTQVQFADLLDMHAQTASDIERGVKVPALHTSGIVLAGYRAIKLHPNFPATLRGMCFDEGAPWPASVAALTLLPAHAYPELLRQQLPVRAN